MHRKGLWRFRVLHRLEDYIGGDSGIYLRSTPQVQIWDSEYEPYAEYGAKEGSGAIWNNKHNPRFPLVKADKPIGEWNTFYIKIVGERVTVKLNGQLVVDNVIMENYWEPANPISAMGSIELQIIEGGVGDFILVHGSDQDGNPVPLSLTSNVSLDRDGEVAWHESGGRETFNLEKSRRVNWSFADRRSVYCGRPSNKNRAGSLRESIHPARWLRSIFSIGSEIEAISKQRPITFGSPNMFRS